MRCHRNQQDPTVLGSKVNNALKTLTWPVKEKKTQKRRYITFTFTFAVGCRGLFSPARIDDEQSTLRVLKQATTSLVSLKTATV